MMNRPMPTFGSLTRVAIIWQTGFKVIMRAKGIERVFGHKAGFKMQAEVAQVAGSSVANAMP